VASGQLWGGVNRAQCVFNHYGAEGLYARHPLFPLPWWEGLGEGDKMLATPTLTLPHQGGGNVVVGGTGFQPVLWRAGTPALLIVPLVPKLYLETPLRPKLSLGNDKLCVHWVPKRSLGTRIKSDQYDYNFQYLH
jgi:hypothetical protein